MEVNFRLSPPKRVIVHCGLTKTGSTALQIQLFENRDRLTDFDFYIPTTGIHYDNRMPGITRTDGHRFIFSPNGTERDWADLHQELGSRELQKETLVLSCENMAQAGIENFQAICDRFLGAPVEFHFLVRDFTSWLPSQISEYAIGGNTRLVPDDHRLLHNPRHGIVQQIERLCALEQSDLDVHFHSYESLKGDDIAINFLCRTDHRLETNPQFGQSAIRAGQYNNFEHNYRFVLLAMRFNQATRDLGLTEYQAGHYRLMELAKRPFYRLSGDQSCVLSKKFMEDLGHDISSSIQGEFDKGSAYDLLFPTGLVKMPTASRFDVGELTQIGGDLETLLSNLPIAKRSTSVGISVSGLSRTQIWPTLPLRRYARAAIRALRRSRQGTKLVLWLRQFALLRRLYGG